MVGQKESHPARRVVTVRLVPAAGQDLASLGDLVRRLAPADCRFDGDGPADVTVYLNDTAANVTGTEKYWLLAWSNGACFESTNELARMAWARHGVCELHLLRWDKGAWHRSRQAVFSAVPGDFAASFARACDRAARMIAQALIDDAKGLPQSSGSSFSPAFTASSPGEIPFRSRLKLGYRRIAHKIRRIALSENWMIGWVDAPIETAPGWKTLPPIQWIGKRSSERYLADPFAWPGKDVPNVIFCEDYDCATGLGSLKKLTLTGNDITGEAPVDFGLPGHLSFPFLFVDYDRIYCMPESCAAGRLVILQWLESEARWQEIATPLPDTAAADAVIFKYGENYWIGYTDLAIDPFDNLNLYFSASLTGPWQPHANNPVKLDPRSSRNGGTPFTVAGTLYRPVQDCSETYGGALRIMRIVECSPTVYREEEIVRLLPEPGQNPHGLHTLSAWGDRCLIDAKRMSPSGADLIRKIRKRARL